MKTAEHAVRYHRMGWVPIPVGGPQGKSPLDANWPGTTYEDEEEVAKAFAGGQNVGVILGPRSKGLADIDLDIAEALDIAGALFGNDRTIALGRKSLSQASHYLFKLTDLQGNLLVQLKDPTDGKMLVELRASSVHQTVFPPSRYTEGDHSIFYSTAELAERDQEQLVAEVTWIAATSLLARHWPGEGSRHTCFMALAGALLMGNMELERVWGIFQGILLATGDTDGGDRRRALTDTHEKIQAGADRLMSWGTLAQEGIPEAVLSKIREWLSIKDHRFEGVVTVRELAAVKIPPMDWLFDNVIPRESITWMHGVAGEGKTIVAMHIAAHAANIGMRVLHLDAEMGTRLMARRVQSMLWAFQDEDSMLRYLYVDEEPPHGSEADWFLSKVRTEQPDFIIIDPYVSWLSRQGLSENDSTENRQLFDTFIKPLKQELGCTVLVLDHEAKGEGGATSARGTGDKMGSTDLAYSLSTQTQFSPGDRGKIRLTRTKNRLGLDTEAVQYFVVGGGEPLESARADGLTVLQHNVREHVRAYAGANGAELAKHTGMDKGNLSRVLSKLEDLDEIEVRVDGRSKRYYPASEVSIDLSDDSTGE